MAAARALLLGDLQSVSSVARRRFGFLLAESDGDDDDDVAAACEALVLLRARVQRCENLAELSPALALRPLLDLVRHEHASSPLTAAALGAVRNILGTWPWRDGGRVDADALADVVDAVSHCRFQETSAESDQNVVALVVAVLRAVLASRAAPLLSDHALWQLIESLYALSRAARSDRYITFSLRASATSVLHDAVAFLFTSPAVFADATAAAATVGFGLPCAVKTLGFLCQKLHQRSSNASTSSASGRRDVLLALDLLRTLLLTCDAHLLTHESSLMLFIKDDLCSGLLRFCRLGACSDLKITLRCLEIVRLLWTKLRAVLKMQLEALFNGVFCNALHWTIASLDVASAEFVSGNGSSSIPAKSAVPLNGGRAAVLDDAKAAGRRVDAATDEFTGEMLPLSRLFAASVEILDCLVDLLAEPTLLPDLYVNYDCDGNRSDLTLNFFELLSQVVRHSHVTCRETVDEAHFLWAQGVGELALRGLFNALYVVYLRSQHKRPKVIATSVASEDDSNDDGLLEESGTSASPHSSNSSGAGYASAEALYRRRQRKKFFQHGIQEFNRKPIAGIKYLQQNTFLPTPLDAQSLAAFMRSLPQGLNKNSVGAYLGAMGKDVKAFEKAEIHEADTMDFHREVLVKFVESFNFEGESIVAALRMFLASFRLPGEAQQIDRILNTFSLQVFEQCRDRFLMASADVAYLLSFSLIMLNTDLHNPNIRPEKKMKLEDFIKNNKNYGAEVSNGRDLPDDFLTEMYDTIASDEIKTFEDGGKHGEVTTDRWKDLLNQAESDPNNSRLIVHHRLEESLTAATVANGNVADQSKLRLRRQRSRGKLGGNAGSHDSDNRPRARSGSVYDENTEEKPRAAGDGESLPPSSIRAGDQYDRHIFELVQSHLVQAFASVFELFVAASNSDDGVDAHEGSSSLENGMQAPLYIPEKSMLQLGCNGLVLCAGAASHLALPEHFNAIFTLVCKYTGLFPSDVYPLGFSRREDGVWLFCNNQSASMATAGMLKLVNTCSLWLNSESWANFFHAISTLREFQALPSRLLRQNTSGDSLTAEERADFVKLVYRNKEEIQRREERKRMEVASSAGSSGFFSGVAWLMSAFESYPSSSNAGSSSQADALGVEAVLPSNPVEWTEYAHDLVLPPSLDDASVEESSDDESEFGTEAWIRSTLEPFRMEFLVQDLSSLPVRVLLEIVKALDDETICALNGLPKVLTPPRPLATGRRPSMRKLRPSDEAVSRSRSGVDASRILSPAGCVLFEHLLSQIISQSMVCEGEALDDEDGVFKILESHYTNVLQAILPILTSNDERLHRISFENACFVLQKAIDGVFALASKSRSERSRDLVTHLLGSLVDTSADDELVRPFLSQILSQLKAFFASATLDAIRYTREQWLIVTNLIGWSVDTTFAAARGFALLEFLVNARVWRIEDNDISISDCYTKALMFALAYADEEEESSWKAQRFLELLRSMFSDLDLETESENEEAIRLRFLGGFLLVCRQLVKRNHELAAEESSVQHSSQQSLNECVVKSLGFIQEMLASGKRAFGALSWLEILQHGILPLGVAILDPRANTNSIQDDRGANPRILYYQQQLSNSSMLLASTAKRNGQSQKQQRAGTGRRRRPSAAKDPLALRPHVLVVQLVSGVVCEELSVLARSAGFSNVWDEIVDLLIGLLRHTQIESTSAVGDTYNVDLALAALERRSTLSAHEEILEHVRAVARRLSALEQSERRSVDEDRHAERVFPALTHSLVEKCQLIPGLFDQLFPSRDDSRSSGEFTPPLLDEEENGASIGNEAL